jgi:hypothetical protein
VNGTNFSNVNYISVQEHDGSWPAVSIVTKTGDLYTWGNNSGLMIGRNSSSDSYDPGFPNGFTSGTDKALTVEIGGHTTVYLKEGSTQFCYVGHKVSGSMGDGSSASSNESTFNCSGTPSLSICGSVPITADPTTSTIISNPTSITANGTSTITVQLKDANGNNLTTTGGNVVITTNKGTLGNVTDNNNGTYTAILTSSNISETATLGFSINGTTASGTNSTTNVTFIMTPTITIEGKNSANVTRASGSKTNDATLTLTFTTSESTTNFVVGDVTVSGGTLSSFSGSGTSYTATLTPSGTGTITVDVNSGTFSNTDGLNNTAATQYVWIYDNTAPTITITGKNSSNTNIPSGSTTNDTNLTLTFTTSESTGNFTATDVIVTGGTLSNFTGSSSTYTATLTPAAPGPLTVNVSGST